MLVIYSLLLFILGAGLFAGGIAVWAYAKSREWRDPRTIICPETREQADVRVDGALAASTELSGQEQLRVSACSRWPERERCDQACTAQVRLVGDDRSFTRFAPFGLPPRFLRINSPVRMSRELYSAHVSEFARQAAKPMSRGN